MKPAGPDARLQQDRKTKEPVWRVDGGCKQEPNFDFECLKRPLKVIFGVFFLIEPKLRRQFYIE
jgi:hypothetical protein